MIPTIDLSISAQFLNKELRPEVRTRLESANRSLEAPFAYRWQSRRWTIQQLYQHVAAGGAWCVARLRSDHRHSKDFLSSQIIGIDLDRNASIAHLLQNDFVRQYAALLYATPNSIPEMPKSRVVFALDSAVSSEAVYRDYVLRLHYKFAEFGAQVDESCKDSVRLFFGSTQAANVGGYHLADCVLPLAVLESLSLPATEMHALPHVNGNHRSQFADHAVKVIADMVQDAPDGGKHHTLLKASRLAGGYVAGGILSEFDAVTTLESAIASKPNVADLGQAQRTIQDGLSYGKAEPITISDLEAERTTWVSHHRNGNGSQQAEKAESKPTHDVLRDRWLSPAGRICYGLGDFRRYQDGLWPVIKELTVKREISEVIEAARPEGIKLTAGLLSSVAELARVKIAVDDDGIFDAQADYLVCANGTLHIPTRTLGQHRPEIYATSGVTYDYDPQADAPGWKSFLIDLTFATSQAVVDFLQEFSGYALTTDTSHEISVWLYGPPGSGKSTFLTGLQAMLGSRAGLLGLADIERNRFALANLPGKTLAIATEQPGDFIASAHVLNSLISGEPITVDRKFRDAIEVTPRCKLAWAMNELPRVSDPNSGVFRRVKVVEFPVIPEAQRDPALKERIKTEGAGILNWALAGLDRLRNRGRFDIPAEVKAATQSFKDTNDIPARFVEECCVTGNDQAGEPFRTQTGELYIAYRLWCERNGHKPQSSTGVATDWKRLGFEKRRPGGVVFWYSVGLKAA